MVVLEYTPGNPASSQMASTQASQQITLDAAVSQKPKKKVVVTQHPVETGANASDHVRRLPETVDFDGYFSDNPIPSGANSTTVSVGSQAANGRAKALLNKLWDLCDSATLFSVQTTFKTWVNMVITDISPDRSKEVKAGEKFSISFQEMTFATSQSLPITKPTTSRGQQKTQLGPQTPAPASPGETAQAQSDLLSLGQTVGLNKISSLFSAGGQSVP